MMLERVILDHHGLGYLALWYGLATAVSGLILLLVPRRIRRFSHYVRLIHLITGATAVVFGTIAFLVAP